MDSLIIIYNFKQNYNVDIKYLLDMIRSDYLLLIIYNFMYNRRKMNMITSINCHNYMLSDLRMNWRFSDLSSKYLRVRHCLHCVKLIVIDNNYNTEYSSLKANSSLKQKLNLNFNLINLRMIGMLEICTFELSELPYSCRYPHVAIYDQSWSRSSLIKQLCHGHSSKIV